ncbi:MAG: DNA-processing protein DprA [Myxococcota bacterium]|nr:DNA-processing protein DprA [Myxococcota bacterium]
MPILSPFWSAAVPLSGRLDLSGLVDVEHLESASEETLIAGGVRPRHARLLRTGAPPMDVPHAVRLVDRHYPAALRRVPFAPPVLFMEGDPSILTAPLVALVGARRCTGNGRRMTRRLAAAVATAGGVVVSGLAQGIDCEAHAAAGGRTVAVLGQGLSLPLPTHRARVRRGLLRSGGLVMSELPPKHPASRSTFPRRNRIIAGVSKLTVVVEARERSGARITARNALEAGRDVFAVPGHPLQETAAGCLALLREGAGLVTEPRDILDALGLSIMAHASIADPLLKVLGDGSTFEELLCASGLPAPALLQQLAEHELAGRIKRLPGDRYTNATR